MKVIYGVKVWCFAVREKKKKREKKTILNKKQFKYKNPLHQLSLISRQKSFTDLPAFPFYSAA